MALVVILTAIKEEYLAIRSHLNNLTELDKDDTIYEIGKLIYNEILVAEIIIRECGAKNSTSSQETERAIQYFKPNAIFFLGIAGSRKPNDFSIGDVIFPEKIYSYESGKAGKDSFQARPDISHPTYTMLEKAKKARLRNEWKALLPNKWNQDLVKADIGVIASGEQLIEDYYSSVGKILTEHYNDTSVVEMEGFAFAKAAQRQGGEQRMMEIGVVRGISDIMIKDQLNETSSIDDRRPVENKLLAAATASAFTIWLIIITYYNKLVEENTPRIRTAWSR
jgi:nucleoside phosphorylase